MKFNNGSEMIEYALKSMQSIALDPEVGSRFRMITIISHESGLGRSTVQKFWTGQQRTPTVATMDKLLDGIQRAKRTLAE
jgi:hypothetical protein